jgi:hypothetical protein
MVAGKSFLLTIRALALIKPPAGFALLHDLREAWRIIVWDDAAIRRVMDDARSLRYGVLFWVIGNALPSRSLPTLGQSGVWLQPSRN